MRLLDEDEAANPLLSVTNLIDVFLVLIAALLISIAQNPMNPFLDETVTVIKNAGQPDMELIIKDGETIETYKSSGEIGNGEGCLLYTSPSPRDLSTSRMPSSA